MLANVPYISARANRDGSKRWYWVRQGYSARRLPDDESARLAQALEWNRQADAGQLAPKPASPPQIGDTVAWYVDHYERSAAYRDLAPSTRKNYRRQLEALRATFPRHRIAAFNRKLVKQYLADNVSTDPLRRVARNVLLNLFELAIDNEDMTTNPAANLRLPGSPKRDSLWEPEQIAAFWDACSSLGKSSEMLRTAFSLLVHTGQRPVDVLKMRWDDYDGEFIKVVQQKTGAKVDIYCHPELKARLDAVKPTGPVVPLRATILVTSHGGACSYNNLRVLMRRMMGAIGADDLMTRDLRRTAVTRLYEADCSEGVIASITGHSIEACRRILDTYRVSTRAMSKLGITKLADYQKRRRDESA